jgi:toxin ParE1/3/4
MRALRLSPKAFSDLDGIWEHSAREWGMDQAETYLREINRAFEILRRTPEIATAVDHVRLGLRRFPSGSHVIFLRFTTERLDVVRILHGRMDARSHL